MAAVQITTMSNRWKAHRHTRKSTDKREKFLSCNMEKAGKQPFTELSLRDLYCIRTDMAALPKTDVHASAQRSQLFPNPSEHCCADSQILTHPAMVFKKYFPPAQEYKKKTFGSACGISLFQSNLH